LVIDIDGKNAREYVIDLLEKYNIIDDVVFTYSISKKLKIYKQNEKDYKYRYHIWFKNNLNLNNKSLGDLELLTNKLLFEHKDEFERVDFDNLPNIRQEFYNDLLNYKLQCDNVTQGGTIPQGPDDINNEIITNEIIINDEEKEKEKYNDLLNILSDTRADKFEYWINVLYALKNKNNDYLDIFHDFSKRCKTKYNFKDVKKKWKEIKKRDSKGITIATIISYAQENNKQLYNEWYKKYYGLVYGFDEDKEKRNYENMKKEFEMNNFKVMNPVMYVFYDTIANKYKRRWTTKKNNV